MTALYPLLWRWHFLIGLLAAPVLILISITGALYVFEPQLEPVFESFQKHPPCQDCRRLSYAQLAEIGQAQQPGWLLHELVLPGPGRSVQVQLEHPQEAEPDQVVFLDPHDGSVLHQRGKNEGLFVFILRLHRTLLAGEAGRYLTELVISWVFVTLLLGFALWWPRRARGPGGWWPRLRSRGRRFWRDLHSVTGFYLLPLLLLISFTGLFFSPLAGKSMLGGMYLADQLPALYLDPPKVSNPPVAGSRLPADFFIQDFLNRSGADHFDIHFPEAATDAAVLSTHVAHELWHLHQAHYDPYSGALLGEARWADLKPGAKALMLFFPLHTGNIFGLGTQVLAFVSALLLCAISITGVLMWWRRRPAGQLGLPPVAERQAGLPWPLWPLMLLLACLMPLFGASVLALLLVSGMQRLRRRSLRKPGAPARDSL